MPLASSTTGSSTSDDLDYEVISDPGPDIESSLADLSLNYGGVLSEPHPTQLAREKFSTAELSPEDIQMYVRKMVNIPPSRSRVRDPLEQRTVRVYVDGIFESFHAGHALQLRQAKLSFPSVHLMIGVFADALCTSRIPHVERCELVRHCRWVDEVLPDAPWTIDEAFLLRRRVDYVALDEGTSVDPACDKGRLKGYDLVKSLGKVIPTRRTTGLVAATLHPSRNASSVTLTPSSPNPDSSSSPIDAETQIPEQADILIEV